MRISQHKYRGFTLIELSIVLVVIGLIIGGILTGQDLISAAATRAQLAQIEHYQTAVETFKNKYGALPGDITDPQASSFGFQARGTFQGEGDGNGVIEGNCWNTAGTNNDYHEGCGELAVFWEDISEVGLIDATIQGHDKMGSGYAYTQGYTGATCTLSSTPGVKDRLPYAKIGNGVFVYVMSMSGINYFAFSAIQQVGWEIYGATNPGITVQQAYNMDSKVDDGLPQAGNVQAMYMNWNVFQGRTVWAAGNSLDGADANSINWGNAQPTTAATPYLNTNCFDNNNVAGGIQKYSLAQNASIQNCALSFKFQ